MSATAVLMEEPAGVPRRRYTRDEYYLMAETGVLGPEERVELIGGEIVPMAPQGPDHAAVGDHLRDVVAEAFGAGYLVRVQRPLALGQASDPEPDIAVVPGSWRDYVRAHPTTALLVVEVSRTSLALDRGVKASLYAAAGIAEYWIVNLQQRLVEVHREPISDAIAAFGACYARIERLASGAVISPLAAPQAAVRVDDLLPPDA